MKVDGSCHCGAIRFEAEVTPGTVWVCHCTDCQSLTGSAFRTTILARADSLIVDGTPAEYIRASDTGQKKRLSFCGICGTPMFGAEMKNPSVYSLRVGTIRQREELGSPAMQIWHRSAQGWLYSLRSVPRTDTQP
jgi:hypothetical protein